jgi:hypothetical protein
LQHVVLTQKQTEQGKKECNLSHNKLLVQTNFERVIEVPKLADICKAATDAWEFLLEIAEAYLSNDA